MSDGNYEAPVPKDAPVMIAWNAYKASEAYSIVKKWAAYPEHVDGQLWAAFYSGFFAAAVNEAPRMAEHHIAGLREAAEIAKKHADPQILADWDRGFESAVNSIAKQILARIAELEQKS